MIASGTGEAGNHHSDPTTLENRAVEIKDAPQCAGRGLASAARIASAKAPVLLLNSP